MPTLDFRGVADVCGGFYYTLYSCIRFRTDRKVKAGIKALSLLISLHPSLFAFNY